MRNKNYKQKRKDLKKEKREITKTDYVSTEIRKAKIADVKREFRSLKRSEKQVVKKQIEREIE